jgi:hypothetical protein
LFHDTATTEIYTLSLHDALPILTSPPIQRKSFFYQTKRISISKQKLILRSFRTQKNLKFFPILQKSFPLLRK